MSDALKPLINAAADGPLSRAQAEAAFGKDATDPATLAQLVQQCGRNLFDRALHHDHVVGGRFHRTLDKRGFHHGGIVDSGLRQDRLRLGRAIGVILDRDNKVAHMRQNRRRITQPASQIERHMLRLDVQSIKDLAKGPGFQQDTPFADI